MARITCYDGVGCIGGNKILLEDGDVKIWLDFGLNFGHMGTYYEEFLKPKNCMGIYEPVKMGLLPPFHDLYRQELLCSLANPWESVESSEIGKVDGILVSHAHLDHIAQIHYVREDVPVYTSAMSLAIAKAVQDTGAGMPDQYCYTTPYEASETGELKSAYFGKNPSKSRPYVFVGESPSDRFMDFWAATPSSLSPKGRKHESVPIQCGSECGGLKIRRYPVDHSLYGASAWAIQTSAGWVVYTGDLRCHGLYADSTWKFVEEVSKLNPIALIIEGTRIDSSSTQTESQISEHALEAVKKSKGLAVADFGPRNVERLSIFLQIAKETGRKLILLPKDAYMLEKMSLADDDGRIPSLDDPGILIYNKYEASSQNWKKLIGETYESKSVKPSQITRNQDKAICCFSFFDVNELAYINPTSDSTWIYSSCEPFNEEMQIDFDRLRAWVDFFGMDFPAGSDPDDKSPFHVSGHASRADLQKIIEIIRPKTVIPIHSETPNLFAEILADKSQSVIPLRQKSIELG